MSERHILDLRAGVPWSAGALDVFSKSSRSSWGNPAHPSSEGRRAATWMQAAAATMRELTGLPEVSFFADRHAALDAVLALRPAAVTVAAETHRKAVLRRVATRLPVDADGLVAWSPDAEVALEQSANEETGVVDPVSAAPIRIVDASNTFGRTADVRVADFTIADASAWGAPGGIAMVLGREPVPQPDGVPLPLIALAVHHLAEHWADRGQRAADEAAAVTAFEQRVSTSIPDVQFHGRERVAHIRSFSVLHLDAETLMRALDVEGFVVGSGSACVADGTPSHVLAAMGRVTHGNIRLALPIDLDLTVLTQFADTLAVTVARLREEAGVDDL